MEEIGVEEETDATKRDSKVHERGAIGRYVPAD